MHITVATFNVENLFSRPIAMDQADWTVGQPYLDDCAQLNLLLNHDSYSAKDKADILKILKRNGLDKTRPTNAFLELRKVKGSLLKRSKGNVSVEANGRGDWVGWVELKRKSINDEAITNTARVIAEVNADIVVLVEVEDRPTLKHFHEQVLKPMFEAQGLQPYEHLMLIDGNDERGIDVGIMSRMPISRIRSHVDDGPSPGHPIFSRDCPEYYIQIGDGTGPEIVVLPNHLTSKGSDRTGARRKKQSAAVKAIYDEIRKNHEYVVVAGDFNDYPASGSLDPLLLESDLKDAMDPALGIYAGKYPGTYQHATAKEKLDYLLLSPKLAGCLEAVDVDRHGFYAPTKWDSFENINKDTKNRYQASDHHCVWAKFNI